jgi:hypothetical protein
MSWKFAADCKLAHPLQEPILRSSPAGRKDRWLNERRALY